MKKIAFSLLIFGATLAYSQSEFQPKNSTILQSIDGDLDKDGIPEKVVAYNTNISTDSGFVREIQILKKVNNKWTLWVKSRNALLKSKDGGMMGDPFEMMTIKNNVLSIVHTGGSSWKWSSTDKYRFQNGEFQLIGATNISGRPGDYWTDIDINLSTGKIVYKKEVEGTENPDNGKSENETAVKKGIKFNLQNRYSKEPTIIMKLPKTKAEIYL